MARDQVGETGASTWRTSTLERPVAAVAICIQCPEPNGGISLPSLLFALTLSAMSTETEQCYLWDLSADCLTTTMYNHTKLYPKARANAAARSGKSLGGGSAALNAPGAEFCCEMSNLGFIEIYDQAGGFALAAYASFVLVLFDFLCEQLATCGPNIPPRGHVCVDTLTPFSLCVCIGI